MRTYPLWLAGLVLLATQPVPAAAGTGSTATGGCLFVAAHDGVGPPNEFAGVVAGAVTMQAADGSPASGVVTCAVRVNGVTAQPAVASGTGAVTPGRAVRYVAEPRDRVEVCATVDFEAPDPTPSVERCDPPPGEELRDFLDSLGILRFYSPLICVATMASAGDYGPVAIGPDGDVYVNGRPWWDCAPYQWRDGQGGGPAAHAGVVVLW